MSDTLPPQRPGDPARSAVASGDTAVPASAPAPVAETKTGKTEEEEKPFWPFLLKLVIAVFIFRAFLFSPFTIPSESMLPRLQTGDYLAAQKWPYGYSRWSMPFNAPILPGRVFADTPERGDVVIFKHPVDKSDYIKRVIGLPGDTVQMRSGVLILNGQAIPKQRIDDFLLPASANTACYAGFAERGTSGEEVCRYPRYRETLPNGVAYDTLDLGAGNLDSTTPVVVPEGQLFLMGDNRDNSLDSRVPAVAGGGIGLVDQDLLVGKASAVLWSTDGSAEWIKPWTWFSAARWDRMGDGI